MLKKIIIIATLLFALSAGTTGVLREHPAAAKEPCAGVNCSPANNLTASYRGDLPPLW